MRTSVFVIKSSTIAQSIAIGETRWDVIIGLGGFDSYVFVYSGIVGDSRIVRKSLILNGRGERIRTSDPLVPNQVPEQEFLTSKSS